MVISETSTLPTRTLPRRSTSLPMAAMLRYMINLIGELPARADILALPGLHWHDYGKSARPGRKLGHVTLVENTAPQRDLRAFKVLGRVDRATWLAIR